MSASGSRSLGNSYSARETIAAALDALGAAEQAHQQALDRAAAGRDAALKQAAAEEQQRVQQAAAAATKQRDAASRVVAEVNRLSTQASDAVAAASINLPALSQTIVVPSSSGNPEQDLAASQREVHTAFADLGRALQELDRVRKTLVVRAMHKIGLPPL